MGRVLACALLISAGAGFAQVTPTFRSEVRLVRLFVTVKDRGGAPVGTMQKSDFRVFDNGVEQTISVFERETEMPLSVAVLIDTSGSTAKELKSEIDSVHRFLRAFLKEGNAEDRAAVYTFNWQVTRQTSFTRDLGRLEDSIRRLKPEGGTSLYDGIYLAANELEDRPGRHAIIVVTDGGDTTSAKSFHQALEAAHLADSVLYPIVIVPITNDAGRNIGGENALTTFAQGTGGRIFSPTVGPELDTAFEEILRDLRTQYLVGYYPRNVPPSKNRFHTVRVEVNRPGLRVSTRNGYYGDADGVAQGGWPRSTIDAPQSSFKRQGSGSDVDGAEVLAAPDRSRHSRAREVER